MEASDHGRKQGSNMLVVLLHRPGEKPVDIMRRDIWFRLKTRALVREIVVEIGLLLGGRFLYHRQTDEGGQLTRSAVTLRRGIYQFANGKMWFLDLPCRRRLGGRRVCDSGPDVIVMAAEAEVGAVMLVHVVSVNELEW